MKFTTFALVFALTAPAVHASSWLPGSCNSSCSSQCQSDLSQLELEILSFKQTQCGSTPPPVSGGQVEFFHSDSCSGNFLGVVGPGTDCQQFAQAVSSNVWGVRHQGVCYDISDTDAKTACARYRGGQAALFHSDSCATNALIGIGGPNQDCDAFSNAVGGASVWGVKFSGSCSNISDIFPKEACLRFQGGSIGFYHSDSCKSSDLIATIDSWTDCDAVASSGYFSSVWGVSVNGVCNDISDTDFKSACIKYGGH